MTTAEHAALIEKRRDIMDRIDALETAGRFADADALLQQNYWVINYDDAGNWTGPVANENGWTA